MTSEEYIAVTETFGIGESNHPSVDTAYGQIIFYHKDGTKRVVSKDSSLYQKYRISRISADNKKLVMKENSKSEINPFLILGIGLLIVALIAGIILVLM